MTTVELIRLLSTFASKFGKRIFTLREIVAYSGESETSVGMTLVRARKTGIVDRVKNLWFNKMDAPALADIALVLESPSYISFESALYHHGVLSQAPKDILTLATTERPCLLRTSLGEINFRHLSRKVFFGFDEKRMAYPEKAFLDLIYIRRKMGIQDFSEVFYLDTLNKKRLKDFASKFPEYVWKSAQKLMPR